MRFYRRNLPHLIAPNYPFFVTTQLAGSLPKPQLKQLRRDYQRRVNKLRKNREDRETFELKNELHRQYFIKYDRLLHASESGPHWLADWRIARVVNDCLLWGDGKRYHLVAFTIMPNHIHAVLYPILKPEQLERKGPDQDGHEDVYFLARILETVKKFSAREANKILKRRGSFWQHESFDHLLRDELQLRRAVHFTIMNPVKEKLADRPEEYRWNYVNWNLL